MFLKTFDEMLKEYALKIEKVGEEVQVEDIILSRLGMCEAFVMLVVWVETKNSDVVLRFVHFDEQIKLNYPIKFPP